MAPVPDIFTLGHFRVTCYGRETRSSLNRWLLTLILGLSLGTIARSQPPESDWRMWFQDLTSPVFDTREAATLQFLKAGEAARPFLEKSMQGVGIEARLRIESILRRLSKKIVTLEQNLSPTLVTLAVDQVPAWKVAETLSKYAGKAIRFGRPGRIPAKGAPPAQGRDRPISFKVKDEPLLRVLDLLAAQSNCVLAHDYRTGDVLLTASMVRGGLVKYVDALRIEAQSIAITKRMTFGQDPYLSGNLIFNVTLEPGLKLVGFLSPPKGVRAKDDQGRDIKFNETKGQRYLQDIRRSGRASVNCSFEPPLAPAKLLKSIQVPLDFGIAQELTVATVAAIPTPSAPPRRPVKVPAGEIPPEPKIPVGVPDQPEATSTENSAPTNPLNLRLESIQELPMSQRLTLTFDPVTPEGPSEVRQVPQYAEVEVMGAGGGSVRLKGPVSISRRGKRQYITVEVEKGPLKSVTVKALLRWKIIRKVVSFEELELP